MGGLSGKTAIVGIGETRVGKLGNITSEELIGEASAKAIMDAGLTNRDIDAVLTQSPYTLPMLMHSTLVAEYMGISPNITSAVDAGGASPVGMVIYASALVAQGLANAVLCVYGENQAAYRTGHGVHPGFLMGAEEFEYPFGCVFSVTPYALAATRYIAEYNAKPEHMGAIAVSARKHAVLNDNSQMRKPLTMEEYLNSRIISSPFRLFDCSLISDGGGAVVVTSAERAKDLKNQPAYILGVGGKHTHKIISQAPSLTEIGAGESSRMAFRQAGLTLRDVDVAELYDCFTITTILQLEAMGFCQPGEGGDYALAGNLDLGSEIPVNTHGGLLSQAHIDGMLHITEAVKQLRGVCGPRQVDDAEIALVTGNGGMLSTHYTLLLGTAPT